jgi:glycogen synthase
MISHLLKPPDEVRIYEKLGRSFAKIPETEVFLVGNGSTAPESLDNISFHTIFKIGRLGWKRLLAPWQLYGKILEVKPDINVVNTIDFQLVTILNKIIFGNKAIYDIPENLLYNSFYMNNFRGGWGYVAGVVQRWVEWVSGWAFDAFFLAEQSYFFNMPFVQKKSIVLENKLRKPDFAPTLLKDPFSLLITGTLSRSYGLPQALDWADAFYESDKRFHLVICGYTALRSDREWLKEAVSGRMYCQWIDNEGFISHVTLLKRMQIAPFALLPYPVQPALALCFPSKCYEYGYFMTVQVVNKNPYYIFRLYEAGFRTMNMENKADFLVNDIDINSSLWVLEDFLVQYFIYW